jgi:DNA-directed RNA polymerase beta' subunit
MRIEFLDMPAWANSRGLQLITNVEGWGRDKKWTPDGLYSERIFGRMYGDSSAYACACGAMHGRFNQGQVCFDCNEEVIRREFAIKRFGAIHFGGEYLISPFFYTVLQKIFGKTTLEKIIAFDGKLDADGNLTPSGESTGDLAEYHGRGIAWFIDNFEEAYSAAKPAAIKRGLGSYIELIDGNIQHLFIGFMPVFSHRLRPAIVVGDKLSFDKINNYYTQLVALSNTLREVGDGRDINKIPLLVEMQRTINAIYDRVIEAISGKTGFIRNGLVGNRVNFSSRMVIVPLEAGHDIDEVHLPYLTVLELYKFHILNVLQRNQNMSYVEALREWNKATTKFSRRVYEIMKSLIERGTGSRVLVNRNPTISVGSILYMRLTKIKEDMTDLTMSISNNVLKFLGGDFDGDVLSVFLVLDEQYKKHFEPFNPKRFVVSPNDGQFNHFLALERDHALGLTTLCNL